MTASEEGGTATGRIIAGVCLAAALVLPLVSTTYYLQFAGKAYIMAMLALALNLAVGHGGLVSLCHGALFGVAGYALAIMAPRYDAPQLLLTMPIAVAASTATAFVIGALALRTRGIYFIMVTLAFGEMLFFLFHDTKIAGGSDGAYINIKPELVIAGIRILDLDATKTFYYVVLACLVLIVAVSAMLIASPFGRALAAARDNERRARAIGFPVTRIRLTAFTMSGAMAGVAGYLAAAQFGFVAPQMLGWHVSATVLVMVLIGGLRSVMGPVVGAFVLIGLEDVLKSWTEYWKLAEGLIIIAIVLLLPNGVRQVWPLIIPPRRAAMEPRDV